MTQTLEPVRGLDVLGRGVYEIEHAGHEYAVEVDFFDFGEKVHLSATATGSRRGSRRLAFEPGGGTVIEAKMGLLGMRTLKLVDAQGEQVLRPAAGTPEARRASFERDHPTASRLVGALSWLILIVALVVEIPQLADLVADWLGFEFDSPLLLPSAVNTLIGLLAVAAALERALRFKHSRWLD